MKIAINGRFLTKPHTGIGVYTRRLFSSFARLYPESEIVMVAPGSADDVSAGFPPNIKIVSVPEKFPGSAGMKKTYWEQVQVPAAIAKINPDIAHFPYSSNPWRGRIGGHINARNGKTPVVVTVHDVIPWTLPAYRKSVATRLYQDRCRRAVAKADRVITVSQSSKNEIIRICGVPSEKIDVIPNAPAPEFFQKHNSADAVPILQKYGINPNRKYFLYSGGYDPRKNVSMIVKTWAKKIAPRYDIDLVLAGGKSHESVYYSSYDLTDLDLSHSLGASKGKIVFTGFVKDEDFPVLYQFCHAFLNLSQSEGFNLPLLEAGVSGVPAVASDIPVHREVAGKYAEFCPPDDPSALGEILQKLVTDESYRQNKKESSQKYICPYSWEKSAEMLMQTYKRFI
jgi:glycosyltransferase involved in cell wall biosynthesis